MPTVDRLRTEDCARQISWTAILVGAFVGLGLSFLLQAFSVATGLSFVTTDKAGMTTLAVGGFVGLIIGSVACMFTAGFVSGHLGQRYNIKRNLGAVYGFTTWSVMLVLLVLLASHMFRYVNVYTNFVSNPNTASMQWDGHRADRHLAMTEKNEVRESKNNEVKAVDTETKEAANKLGIASMLIFALFFIGAISCTYGGHCGMRCVCKND